MNLIETATSIEASMTPKQLRAVAGGYQGDNQNEDAADFDWHFDPAFPMRQIEEGPAFWAHWMHQEIANFAKDGQPDRYDDMFDQPIQEAIILHLGDDGVGYIWDGCHRTGATAMLGLPTIQAIVGVRVKRVPR